MVVHNVSIRILTLNINGGFVQNSSVLYELVSEHDVTCLQEHLLSELSIILLDTKEGFIWYATLTKQNSAGGRPSGGLATEVNSTLRSVLVESSNYFLFVKWRQLEITSAPLQLARSKTLCRISPFFLFF